MKVKNHNFRLSFSSKFSSFPKLQWVFLCVVIWVTCFSLSQVGIHHSKHSWILMFCGEIWSYSDRHGIICELGLTWRCVCFNFYKHVKFHIWSCLVGSVCSSRRRGICSLQLEMSCNKTFSMLLNRRLLSFIPMILILGFITALLIIDNPIHTLLLFVHCLNFLILLPCH